MYFPAPHILEPTSQHTHTIILLHGRGSTGAEFACELFEARTSAGLSLADHFPGYRWVFPTTKTRWSTVFQEEMSEWFDMYSLSDPDARQELQVEGLRESIELISELVKAEKSVKVVLGGISQGMAAALVALLLLCGGTVKPAAFVGASGWVPFAGRLEAIVKDGGERRTAAAVAGALRKSLGVDSERSGTVEVAGIPMFLGHGTDDAWVDIKLGRQARDLLRSMGFNTTWKEYEGAEEEGHWFKETEEFDDIVAFLSQYAA